MKSWQKKIRTLLIIMPLLLALAWVGAGYFVGRIIKSKLNEQVAEQIGGEFEADSVWYFPPRAVSISDARIFVPVGNGKFHQMLSLGSLDLNLSAIPMGGGPVLIESIDVDQPTININDAVLDAIKINGATTQPSTQPATEMASATDKKKLSEIFRLRKLTVRKGQIELGGKVDGKDAMIWRNIDIDTTLNRKDAANYAFKIAAKSASLANLDLDGTINVDDLLLKIENLVMAVNVVKDNPAEELPTAGQQLCRELGIGGKVHINATANIPLRKIPDATGEIKLKLDDGYMMNTPLAADGVVRAVNGLVVLEGFNLNCGKDEFKISNARLRLAEIDQTIRIQEIVATLKKDAEGPKYPGKIGEILEDVEPQGLFALSGMIAIDRATHKPDLAIMVSSDNAAVALGDYRIPITGIRSDMTVEEDQIKVASVEGHCLGGNVHVDGLMLLDQHLTYSGTAWAHDVDLNTVAGAMQLPQKQQDNLAGKCALDLSLLGTAATLQGVGGNGTFQIQNGKLWEVPVMKQIVDAVPNARRNLTAGEAAAVFEVKNQQVVVKKAAVNAPALGVQGTGTVGFDGKLNLAVIAVPLSEWKKHIQDSNIPVIGNVIGEVAGAVQKGVNTVTQFLLYEFRIEGMADDPKLRIVPSPGITRAGMNLFNSMIEPRGKKLIDSMEEK